MSTEPFTGRKLAYARVSTGKQDLLTQQTAFVAAGVDTADVYSEHVSGKTADRPQLQAAIRALRPGDQLIITKLDRLARSLRDLLDLIDRVEKAGASLVVLDQQVDTSTPAGRMFVHVLGAVAEFERDLIAARTREALAARPADRRGGRPRALTGKRLRRALDLVEAKELTMPEVAKAVGVSLSTIKRAVAVEKAKAA